MANWNLKKATAALDSLNLVDSNRQIAEYWLSLWTPEEPPTRERFEPRRVYEHVPAMAIFEVMPDGPVICRLAGSYVQAALGFDLTGRDLLDFTPPEERQTRVRFTRAIVDGAISYAVRRFRAFDGTEPTVGEIALPFAGITTNGGCRYLFHSAWRPAQHNRVDVSTSANLGFNQRILPILA